MFPLRMKPVYGCKCDCFAGMDGSSSALPVLPSLFAAVASESFGDIPVATGRLAKRTLCIDGWANGCVPAAALGN
jgi:hypothetical protein